MQKVVLWMLVTVSALSWAQAPGDVRASLAAAVADASRAEEDRQRDPYRKPVDVLAFFQIAPGQTVVELMSGSGYYVDILARAVGPTGKVIAHNSPFVYNRFAKGPLSKRLRQPALSNVDSIVTEADDPQLPTGVDRVIIVLFYHDFYWQEVDRAAVNQAVFAALKPGGIYGIVDHSAEAGSGDRDVSDLHRVDEALVKQEILNAGFILEAESDLLRNPDDPRDYNVFRHPEGLRDRTDRFVLRFRKPLD